jgi:hypothetical protein
VFTPYLQVRELGSLEIKFKCCGYNRNHNHQNKFIQDWAPAIVAVRVPRIILIQIGHTVVATIHATPLQPNPQRKKY